ncbi:hypothetical protein [Pedobacter sandarakinus]|uniref:hypothetical protein n=1 Tax=Pedobacter sandarakinus TaxID=353156 RepID=UPI002246E833|nr:hypothetical protein [Pedobacter sandarakinus]MCX2573929.1 hypothetical protein [Pedobacter sandarakinus]
MKKLELENFGVQELNAKGMEDVNGGGFFGALIGFLVGATLALLSGETTINGEVVSGSDNWFTAGLIGAGAGAVIIPI